MGQSGPIRRVKVSIIIPAFNEEKLLRQTLRGVKAAAPAFDEAGWAWEVIVCDNNSTDSTAAIAAAEGALVIFEPINQISRARNRGAAPATGDWLLFVDADSIPSRELLGAVVRTIQRPDCIGGGATVRTDERHLGFDLLVGLWNWLSRARRWMAGSFIFCETAAFRELGGFTDRLFAAEEIDFSHRLNALGRRRGKRVYILAEHPLQTSARKLHLYSKGEMFRFILRAIRRPRRILASAEDCHGWYDGRR